MNPKDQLIKSGKTHTCTKAYMNILKSTSDTDPYTNIWNQICRFIKKKFLVPKEINRFSESYILSAFRLIIVSTSFRTAETVSLPAPYSMRVISLAKSASM